MSSLRKALFGLLTVPLTLGVVTAGSQAAAQVTASPVTMTSGFYVDPNSNPAVWVRQNSGNADAPAIRTQIAEKAGGRWFGNWSGDIASAVSSFTQAADTADKLPILVAYNIPGRDCGSHSGGGAGSPEAYRTWISRFADGIGNRPAVVIIEPDALAQLDCVPAAEKQTRLDLLKYAVNQFASKNPNTWAYMDGGNATWIEAGEMARRLQLVEVSKIRGFALNTSNYYTTAQSATKGNAIRAALNSQAQFVIDTSRNGNGSNGEWCNPAGRKLGDTSRNGNHISGTVDMLLWLKVPGDSDGSCGIGTGIPAGTFSPVLAKRLITGS
ncbi:glycoside hydrolase family 6 protein [Kribbella catacumbae]|uniref:glycoside hydrolase family 6 protein n=1 Tax=Kribbella catacumbae TaxID=460086 RepID=UPI00035EEC92|nr:glycoside hydrolase family 6 protein [Kribbella catacumbae]